jgi:alkanesulfonate monooxygenase SsuD/methylene tetrahydromethanopterin reductase-like flavin-dependent oxidoreductase (luciferase family)
LALTGRSADGWVPSLRGDLRSLGEMTARLDDAAGAAGREPAAIRRILNVNGTITDGASTGVLRGPVDQWVEELTDLAVGFGFDTFVLWGERPDDLPRFAEEVVPAVREQVRQERHAPDQKG